MYLKILLIINWSLDPEIQICYRTCSQFPLCCFTRFPSSLIASFSILNPLSVKPCDEQHIMFPTERVSLHIRWYVPFWESIQICQVWTNFASYIDNFMSEDISFSPNVWKFLYIHFPQMHGLYLACIRESELREVHHVLAWSVFLSRRISTM